MAREFVKVDEWEDWVPPMEGERELYLKDPEDALVMELRFLTKEQRDHYERLANKHRKAGAMSSADVAAMRQMFSDNVRNIRNYIVDGAPVTTGDELFEVNGDTAMIMAVTQALMERSALDKGLAKKLRSGSASTRSRQPTREPGAAPGATPRSTPTIPEVQGRMGIYDCPTEPSAGSEVVIGGPTQSSTLGQASMISDAAQKAS